MHSADETLLMRGEHRVVVRVWDLVTVVEPEIARLTQAMQRECGRGLVVIPATGANRRRVSEVRDGLRATFSAPANHWYAALVNDRRRLPDQAGILWARPDCRRLLLARELPGWIWTSIGDGPRFATGRRERR